MLQTKDKWIEKVLKKYGNCAIGLNLLKKYGEENIIEYLRSLGYDDVRIEVKKEGKRTKTEIANGQENNLATAIIYTSPKAFEECKKTVKK